MVANSAPSPAITEKLERFVELLTRWQATHNLIARSTLGEIWARHILDSLQLLDHAPEFRTWVDLGSGAGFPGLVVAIASVDRPDRHFVLVEANGKKAAFLRAAIRETGANAVVAPHRAETFWRSIPDGADVVSARALAPLPRLLELAAPYCRSDTVLILLKGQDFALEHAAASKSWDYDVLTLPSATEPGGQIVMMTSLRRKGPHT